MARESKRLEELEIRIIEICDNTEERAGRMFDPSECYNWCEDSLMTNNNNNDNTHWKAEDYFLRKRKGAEREPDE